MHFLEVVPSRVDGSGTDGNGPIMFMKLHREPMNEHVWSNAIGVTFAGMKIRPLVVRIAKPYQKKLLPFRECNSEDRDVPLFPWS